MNTTETRRSQAILFALGDHAGGGLTGAAAAVAVRALVGPELDMVLAMLLGMGAGMLVHLVIGLALSPLLSPYHVMVPGSLIGMYGGMLFAMRDSMQAHAGSLDNAVLVGVVFGVVVTAGVQLYDRVLRGPLPANPSY